MYSTKYTDEIRLCAGVAKVELPCGRIEGRRAKPFNYSGKVILSRRDYAARMDQEIKRVKNLAVGKEWVESLRPPNTLYRNDKNCELDGIGDKKEQHFLHAKIMTVIELLNHQGKVPGIGKKC